MNQLNHTRFLRFFPKERNGLYIIYDRHSFANFFRLLLKNGLDHEESMDFMMATCSFSGLVFQAYIHNHYYRKLSAEDALPPKMAAYDAILIKDLLEMARKAYKSKHRKLNKNDKGV